MKTPEEIEELADKHNKYVSEAYTQFWINGYTQCQQDMADKKYTEEDLIKAKISVYNGYTYWNEEVASDARLCIERLNESLNK